MGETPRPTIADRIIKGKGRCVIKLVEHHIDLHGPGCDGQYARPEIVGSVLSRIRPMAVQTVRMRILHTSRKIGRPMKNLSAAWDIRHGGQTKGPEGATRLLFIAPTLRQAAPNLFEQGVFWDDGPNPDHTAIDLMGAMVNDIRHQKRESERFDTDLLGRVANFRSAFKRGLEWLSIGGHDLSGPNPPAIDQEVTRTALNWISGTPEPRRVRVSGKLDMIRVSDRVFELVLSDGSRVRAVWAEPTVLHLADYLNQPVVVEGQAVFRPSGALLRIDANAFAAATTRDSFFSVLPTAAGELRYSASNLRVRQTAATGVNAIWGDWPGDETEQDVLAALQELS